MLVSEHALTQARSRGFSAEEMLEKLTQAIPEGELCDCAVLLGTTEERGLPDGSNGDTIIAVVRAGEVKTVMLRRSETHPTAPQPFTPEALRVAKVFRAE